MKSKKSTKTKSNKEKKEKKLQLDLYIAELHGQIEFVNDLINDLMHQKINLQKSLSEAVFGYDPA